MPDFCQLEHPELPHTMLKSWSALTGDYLIGMVSCLLLIVPNQKRLKLKPASVKRTNLALTAFLLVRKQSMLLNCEASSDVLYSYQNSSVAF